MQRYRERKTDLLSLPAWVVTTMLKGTIQAARREKPLILRATARTCKARCAHGYNGSMKIMGATNHLLIGCEVCAVQEEIHAWFSKLGQKSHG